MDCFVTGSTTPATATSTANYINGFSYGEIVIATFALMILVLLFFKVVLDRSLGVKSQNRENYN